MIQRLCNTKYQTDIRRLQYDYVKWTTVKLQDKDIKMLQIISTNKIKYLKPPLIINKYKSIIYNKPNIILYYTPEVAFSITISLVEG